MKPEIIDWSNIESIFVEDETYENFKAPKWVDLSAQDELIDDEAWFCNPDCKHPKSAEDFHKSARSLKGKLLRSLSVSEILPSRGKSQRDVKLKGVETKPPSAAKLRNMKTKSSNYVCSVNDESENKNPNMAAPLPIAPCKSKSRKASMTPCSEKKKQGDESSQDSSKNYGVKLPIAPCKSKSRKASMTPCSEKKKQGDESSQDSSKNYGVKPKLKSTFSASNLLKGREILNQITEFFTDMKNLTNRCSRKKTLENSCLKEKVRERMPLIVREGDY